MSDNIQDINNMIDMLNTELNSDEANEQQLIAVIENMRAKLSATIEKRNKVQERIKNNKRALSENEKRKHQIELELKAKQATSLDKYAVAKLNKRAAKFFPEWNNTLFDAQREDAYRISMNKRMLLGNDMGTGKAGANSELVLTSTGYVPFGEITTDHKAIGSSGKPVDILGVYPQGERDIYTVTFNDGAVAKVDGDHIWTVSKGAPITSTASQISDMTTKEILASGIKDGAGNNKYSIPVAEPVEFECNNKLPIGAYSLGAILGDGSICNSSPHMSSADDAILDYMEKDGIWADHAASWDYRLTNGWDGDLKHQLEKLELWGTKSHTKFIPAIYKTASISERLSLLQGLMDTDGGVERGLANYYTVSEQLANDVIEIVNSLGGITRKSYKKIPKGGHYTPITVHVNLPAQFNPFRLERKATKYTPATKYIPARRITAIEYSHKEEATCIRVDADDHLFVMNNYIVTHNTITSIAAADLAGVRHLLCVVPYKLSGNWVDELEKWSPKRKVINIAGESAKLKQIVNVALKILHDQKTPTAVIVNYETWNRDPEILGNLVNLRFDGIIMDEAHAFKNPDTRAFQGVKEVVTALNTCLKCQGLLGQLTGACLSCGYNYTMDNTVSSEDYAKMRSLSKLVLPMTGTFIMNSPLDIFPALNIILPETFDGKREFLEVFATQNFDGKWVFKPGGEESLASKLGARYIKRTMEDMGIVLPEQSFNIQTISLDGYDKQKKVLKDIAQSSAVELDKENVVNITALIAAITRQRQAAVNPDGMRFKIEEEFQKLDPTTGEPITEFVLECDESAKMDWLMDKIASDVLFDGKRVAVFSQFTSNLGQLKTRLESLGLSVAMCTGKTTKKEMDVIKYDFKRENHGKGKYQVVLAHFKVGGAGLNFTDITQSYEMDSPWNPAMRNQAKARTHRIGQTEETNYTVLELSKTIDEWMRTIIEDKAQLIQGFDNATESEAANFTDVLKDIIKKGVSE